MSLIGFWLTTTVTSYILDLGLGVKLFKDLADQGYTIDFDKYKEVAKELNMSTSHAIKFVPFINVLNEMKKAYEYSTMVKYLMVDQLRALGVLKELSDLEIAEYQKKPTGLNAIIVPIKMEIRLSKATKIVSNIEGYKYELYVEIDDKTNEMTVLKKTGCLANKPDDVVKNVARVCIDTAKKIDEKQETKSEEPKVEITTEDLHKEVSEYEAKRDELLTQKAELIVQKEIQTASQFEEEGPKKNKKIS